MNGSHRRLVGLWDALERQGATVARVPLDSITAHTANRLAAAEEKRLRLLAEQYAPGPSCTCHPADVYASCVLCPVCRHRSYDATAEACERRNCPSNRKYERSA